MQTGLWSCLATVLHSWTGLKFTDFPCTLVPLQDTHHPLQINDFASDLRVCKPKVRDTPSSGHEQETLVA